MHIPDCDNCKNRNDCTMLKANKEMHETIWNFGREQSGRRDFILNGKLIREKEEVPP